jgi:hypothetical protein
MDNLHPANNRGHLLGKMVWSCLLPHPISLSPSPLCCLATAKNMQTLEKSPERVKKYFQDSRVKYAA